MNAAADKLISIFGMTRAQCAHCIQSLGTDRQELYCVLHEKLTERDSQCADYERATGSDDE